MNIEDLSEFGKIGEYRYCEVTQIILHNKQTQECLNYFTHILFSGIFTESKEAEFLTDGLKNITEDWSLLIQREIIPVGEAISILKNAPQSQQWEYKTDVAKLDNVFEVLSHFVPETDPTGSKISENTLVPIEQSLYGSNYAGNYYIGELFSAKKNIEIYII